MRLTYDARYDYTGLWRSNASCWLRVFAPDSGGDLPIVIAAELPDNDGTSITNFAERLAWNVAHDPTVWAAEPGAPREGFIWIEHYPEDLQAKAERGEDDEDLSIFNEHFSLVTFSYDPEAEADAGNLGIVSLLSEDGPDDEDSDDRKNLDIADLIERQVHVTAAGPQGTLGEPYWRRITRRRVEQLIGQPYEPIER